MQRVLRDEGQQLVNPQEPDQRQALVHRYCPPSIGHLFASPRDGRSGGLEWWTELTGQPRRFDELSDSEQALLKERLAQRLAALASLTDELSRRGDPAVEELRALPSRPADDTLYSVGGDPLLIRWVPTVPVAAAPGTPPANRSGSSPVPPAPMARQRRRWLLPTALPLLLVGLALLGLWLAFHHWDRFSLPVELIDNDRASTEPVLGTGDVQVTLRWNSNDDLDLAVTDPNGDTAFFNNPTIPSGGQLDVDSNAGCISSFPNPVENVYWDADNTPEGVFVANVSLYTRCTGDHSPIPFELSITLNGNTETRTGAVDDPSPSQNFEFVFP